MADDDWESEFLSTRHVHNRGTRKGGTKGGGGFDVKKTFGSYELKCKSADRHEATSDSAVTEQVNSRPEGKRKRKQKAKKELNGPRLDISRLTNDGNGLLGELTLPRILDAGIILAATRKGLEVLKTQAQDNKSEAYGTDLSTESQAPTKMADESESEDHSGSGVDSEDPGALASIEDKERRRYGNFQKNSFRQPKFWMWWHGNVRNTASPKDASGMGYVVFSGNSCRRFEGTLSCSLLGWEDVALSGWKS